jgi:hypothetical protein
MSFCRAQRGEYMEVPAEILLRAGVWPSAYTSTLLKMKKTLPLAMPLGISLSLSAHVRVGW